jgi:hypothetical protein
MFRLVVSFSKNSGDNNKKCPIRAIQSMKLSIKIYEEEEREARLPFTFPHLFSILDMKNFQVNEESSL